MTDVHPSDRQLAAWLDATEDARPSMSVSDHLMGCHRCRSLIGSAFDSIALPEPPYSTERLSLGTISESTPEDLERGQVWRVRWEDTSQLAMVWSAEIDWVGMIPVTPDPNYADESCVILASEDPDGHSVLWLGLETPLPYHVLDCQVSVLPTDGLKTVRKMLRQGKSIDTIDLKIGQPIMSAFDHRTSTGQSWARPSTYWLNRNGLLPKPVEIRNTRRVGWNRYHIDCRGSRFFRARSASTASRAPTAHPSGGREAHDDAQGGRDRHYSVQPSTRRGTRALHLVAQGVGAY